MQQRTRFNRPLISLCVFMLLMSVTVPTQNVKAGIVPSKGQSSQTLGLAAIPAGFSAIATDNAVALYKKDFAGGNPDYVQTASLQRGATVILLHGAIKDPGTGKGPYGKDNPTLERTPLATEWTKLSKANTDAFCITNGQFFSPTVNPTPLAFPLKKNGQYISDGYDSKNAIYGNNLLMLEMWGNRADIRPLTQGDFLSSTAPNILGGLSETYPKGSTSTGRTFVGINDTDGNGTYDQVLIFTSKTSTQAHAAQTLRDFGADKVIMLDGGGSTQMNCRGTDYIAFDRDLPQTLGVVASGFNSQFTNGSARWTPLNAAWSVSGSGYYHSAGLVNKFNSTMHTNNYGTLTYTVRMKSTGCTNCGNYIYFRGKPKPLNTDGRWISGYVLEYTNNGYFTIGRQQNGAWVSFVDWTYSPAVSSDWNVLKVTASGTFIQFFINGTRVAYGNLTQYSVGQVGIGFYRDANPSTHLYVDYATLTRTAPASALDVNADEIFIDELTAELNADSTADPRMSP